MRNRHLDLRLVVLIRWISHIWGLLPVLVLGLVPLLLVVLGALAALRVVGKGGFYLVNGTMLFGRHIERLKNL